jgi:type I restriction enzyme, S subunit
LKNERIRLRFVAPLRPKTPSLPLTGEIAFLPMEAIGEDGTYDQDSVRPAADITDSGYTYFEQGDVVRARVTPCFENGKGALLSRLTGGRGLGTTELFVFRSSPRIDARFLYYVIVSGEFTGHGTATMYGAHGVRRVEDRFARDYRAWLPPVSTQRVIVAYLDREISRIDGLIGAKRRMVELLEERWNVVLETVIWTDVDRTTRVMHLVDLNRQVMYGIVLPGPDVGDGGIAIIKGGDVAQRRLSWDALCKTTPEIEAPYARARVRGGDLVFAIRGGIGDVAIVPDKLTGANLTQDVARVAPRAGINPEWLMYALQSPATQRDVRRRVTGATITGLNIWELDRLQVPFASPERQQRDIERLTDEFGHLVAMRNTLTRQISLLQERRQALVTAAVTGQLDVPHAA